MARCAAIKANGERCGGTAAVPEGYCWAHAPENAEQRRRQASKAAKSKPSREVRRLKEDLRAVIAGVLEGSVERGAAAVAIQGYNSLARVIELGRKIREQDELEERIEALEAGRQTTEEQSWEA